MQKVLKLPQEVKKIMLDAESTKAPTRSQKDHVRCMESTKAPTRRKKDHVRCRKY